LNENLESVSLKKHNTTIKLIQNQIFQLAGTSKVPPWKKLIQERRKNKAKSSAE